MWWLCASVLAAPDPYRRASVLADEIDADPTPDVLVEALPDDATVCVVGWPDLIGEALLRRGDATVLAIDSDDMGLGSAFVRRLQRSEVEAEVVPATGMAAAVLASDVVVVEALAAGDREILAAAGSRAVASVGYCAEIPVWGVVGRGRCLPQPLFEAMTQRLGRGCAPWEVSTEIVPLGLTNWLAGQAGVGCTADSSLKPECAMSHELLRSSAM